MFITSEKRPIRSLPAPFSIVNNVSIRGCIHWRSSLQRSALYDLCPPHFQLWFCELVNNVNNVYKRVNPFVGPSVNPSVHSPVRPSVYPSSVMRFLAMQLQRTKISWFMTSGYIPISIIDFNSIIVYPKIYSNLHSNVHSGLQFRRCTSQCTYSDVPSMSDHALQHDVQPNMLGFVCPFLHAGRARETQSDAQSIIFFSLNSQV